MPSCLASERDFGLCHGRGLPKSQAICRHATRGLGSSRSCSCSPSWCCGLLPFLLLFSVAPRSSFRVTLRRTAQAGTWGTAATWSREFPYANECGNVRQRAPRCPGGGNFPWRLCQRRSLWGSAWRGPASPTRGWQSALVIDVAGGRERTQVGVDQPQQGGLSQQEKPLPKSWALFCVSRG